MVMKYALYGYDVNTELLVHKFVIPSNKENEVKKYLGLSIIGLFGFDIEIATYKAQEILDKLKICVNVNEYDWFLSEIEEN